MNVILETDRLLLRIFTIDDAPLIYELNLDPEVIRFTYDPVKDMEHARQVLEHVDDPAAACREIMRVSKRGYIELPEPIVELGYGYPETFAPLINRDP